MEPGDISKVTADFINRCISSVEQMEILLLLAADSNRTWSVPEVFDKIQSQKQSVTDKLKQLVDLGLVRCENDRYHFAPQSSELALRVSDLGQAYRDRRVRVIEMIYLKPPSPIQNFADSFKFKKKE